MNTIAKNASLLLVSQLITWVLTLLLTLFCPVFWGQRRWGSSILLTPVGDCGDGDYVLARIGIW
ncbi:MAG: hypothetical protein IPL78_30890 [Chloroflexi bacterium]|nr:hypothetical protein [Chloroflexota bacterium]